jgi:signal transduction histidine kinase
MVIPRSVLAFFSLVLCAAAYGAEPVVELSADGTRVPVEKGEAEMPSSAEAVLLNIRQSQGNGPARRLQFRLEGVDEQWSKGGGEMLLTARFFDSSGDQVGQQTFPVAGESPGWKGSLEESQFTHRRETLRVPERADRLWIVISSAGPPATVGLYVVTDLVITRPPNAGVVFQMPSFTESADAPEGWMRDGTHPSMAKVLALGGGQPLGALGVVDDDLSSHAEWHLVRDVAPRVVPGETLTVEWNEVYDIGIGGDREVTYPSLQPGRYRFVINETDAMGRTLGPEHVVELNVKPPFWQSVWFWIPVLLAAGAVVALVTRAVLRVRMRRQIERMRQEHMVESERLRIARDLHDDLGARLTHISLVSAMAESEAASPAARANIEKISNMARELVSALYETVWTVNPENDRLDSLVNFLCQLAQKLCDPVGIRCRIHACDVPDRIVSSELRHNVTLAVKEAIHNAIKHSGASEIEVRIAFADPMLEVTVEDAGNGFAAETEGHGSGNMRRRMEIVRGTVDVSSESGKGTRVRFRVPIP